MESSVHQLLICWRRIFTIPILNIGAIFIQEPVILYLFLNIRFEKGIDAKAFFAFGNYNCLAFSPFPSNQLNQPEKEPIGKAYNILKQLSHLITKYQPAGAVKGFLIGKRFYWKKNRNG